LSIYLYSHTAKYIGTEKNNNIQINITRLFTIYTDITNNALVERSFLNLKKVKIQSLLYRVHFGKKYSEMILIFFDVTVGIVWKSQCILGPELIITHHLITLIVYISICLQLNCGEVICDRNIRCLLIEIILVKINRTECALKRYS
jgi:hypothetical protein